jgi:hypothetical protein
MLVRVRFPSLILNFKELRAIAAPLFVSWHSLNLIYLMAWQVQIFETIPFIRYTYAYKLDHLISLHKKC